MSGPYNGQRVDLFDDSLVVRSLTKSDIRCRALFKHFRNFELNHMAAVI
jgi:hypothetical protein